MFRRFSAGGIFALIAAFGADELHDGSVGPVDILDHADAVHDGAGQVLALVVNENGSAGALILPDGIDMQILKAGALGGIEVFQQHGVAEENALVIGAEVQQRAGQRCFDADKGTVAAAFIPAA